MASVTGRTANFLSTRLDPVVRALARNQVRLFRLTHGRLFNKFLRKPALVIDVVGRSSGEPRPVMLMRIERGDDFVVCGSNGGNPRTPNWYRNLQAAGEAFVEIPGERIETTFREVTEADERAECWALLTAGYPDFASYQELTDRVLPIGLLERITA